jgi:thiamine biosynthesis lipoprotein
MLERRADAYVHSFMAMASPCEVIVETDDKALAARLGAIAEAEARRVERKFSRYRDDNIVAAINRSGGAPVQVDEETALLLDFAAGCWASSGGLFDITSGVLRRVWRFDGVTPAPSDADVRALLPLIGWERVEWCAPHLTLQLGMEVDLGGIGKEYAVDRAVGLIAAESDAPTLVSFGGDLRVTGPRSGGRRWRVAIESVDVAGAADGVLELARGALTTSGDAARFLMQDGVRLSHILNPRTGWPVKNPPRSVTVAAVACVEAGLLSTLAMLHGEGAERFLTEQRVPAWVAR